MRIPSGIVVVVAAMIATVHPTAQQRQTGKSTRVPADFTRFKDITNAWAPPWVFVGRGAQMSPVPSFHNPAGKAPRESIPVRLEDGSTALLHVLPSPKFERDYEDFRIRVVNGRGVEVFSTDLYPSYAEFDITPIDLVGGPGDELVIVQIKTHASPPTGHFMSVWKLGQKEPIRILEDQDVSNLLGTRYVGCARWKRFLLVDPSEPKPRSLRLRPQFGVDAGAPQDDGCQPEPNQLAELRKPLLLRFNGTRYPLPSRF